MRWTCLACSATYEERPPVCGLCRSWHALLPQPSQIGGRDVAIGPRRRAGVVPAGAMQPDASRAPYGDPWAGWGLRGRHAVLLFGSPGSGKSTVATRMAVDAARRCEVLYIAAEEGQSVALAERIRRAGCTDLAQRRLAVSDARDARELADDLAQSSASIVVLDSLTELSISPASLVSMLADRSWIGVSHANSRGGAYGGTEYAHAVDLVVRVEAGIATPTKNRFGGFAAVSAWPEEARDAS
jgi:predicted ATP-dependent serine protease